MDTLNVIEIKIDKEVYKFDRVKLMNIDFNGDFETQSGETLFELSFINQIIVKLERKLALAKLNLGSDKATFYLDKKNSSGKPPSDTTIEYEMAEETDLKDAEKNLIELKYTINRLSKLAEDMKSKIELLRTFLANQRAEVNLTR
jgi:hypothetical protein